MTDFRLSSRAIFYKPAFGTRELMDSTPPAGAIGEGVYFLAEQVYRPGFNIAEGP